MNPRQPSWSPVTGNGASSSGWLENLASLKWTLGAILLLVMGSLGLLWWRSLPPTWVLSLPMGLLVINLVAAMLVSTSLRRQPLLLLFHLALLALVLLAGASRLTYLKGSVELAMGERFDGTLLTHEEGPWHPEGWRSIRFTHEETEVMYGPGGVRGATRSRMRWWDARGMEHAGVIGDNVPLILAGYRIQPSLHYSFAPVFSWWTPDGVLVSRGAVNLPSLQHGPGSSNDWTIRGTDIAVLVMLTLAAPLPDAQRATLFRADLEHHLTMTIRGEVRHLQPGARWILPEGTLVYERLGTWMGYTLFYDGTIPWLLSTCLVAIVSLMTHLVLKFSRSSWQLQGEWHGQS
ncbi:MAG: hypothetical protein HQL64_03735 [Magnetococcales bacterium]|nr:hypothetical protein [Magnetococcales bacterium]